MLLRWKKKEAANLGSFLEVLVENPFVGEEKGLADKMYNTGDLARWQSYPADGNLLYVGRADSQASVPPPPL